jgi:ornithine carbamoyltransferase
VNQSPLLLTIADLDVETIARRCVDADRLDRDRSGETADVDLTHRTVALVFERPSTRTRLGVESGMASLGGHAVALSGDAMQFELGTEADSDAARAVSAFLNAIVARVRDHETL